MTEITGEALDIAGFALAQAVTSMCIFKGGEQLTPMSIVRLEGGTLRLQEYDAPTQAQAIEAAKSDYAVNSATTEAWAFARESTARSGNDVAEHDAIVVDFWSMGMPYVASLQQRFTRASSGKRFHLDGVPSIVDDGVLLDPDEGALMVDRVKQGIGGHPEAERLWRWWE
jgi:hypothetical protein